MLLPIILHSQRGRKRQSESQNETKESKERERRRARVESTPGHKNSLLKTTRTYKLALTDYTHI